MTTRTVQAAWVGAWCFAVVTAPAPVAFAVEPEVGHQLAAVASRSIFFGHQSVGMNVLDGLKDLAREAGVAIRIVEGFPTAAVPAGTVGHAWVGENHRPETKLEAFAKAIDALPAPGVDVALVKLCYVDFGPETDVAALFARYRETIADLKRRHPGTTFVHVTAPLSTVQGGLKGLAKRALGKPPYGLVENVRREEYNSALRRAFDGKEPLFDLARVEATAPDGRLETVAWEGRAAPALHPAYTDDGGHLNAEGRRRAARELVRVLSALPSPSHASR
jgi:hypothetical protein